MDGMPEGIPEGSADGCDDGLEVGCSEGCVEKRVINKKQLVLIYIKRERDRKTERDRYTLPHILSSYTS